MSLYSGSGPSTPRRIFSAATPGRLNIFNGDTASIASSSSRSTRSDTSIPMSVLFDDIMRHYDHYNNYNCENEFLEFVKSQDTCRKKWLESEHKTTELTTENKNLVNDNKKNLRLIGDVRHQFETKLELISRLESDNEIRRNRMTSAIILIKSYLNDSKILPETKDKVSNVLAILEGVEYSRKVQISPNNGLDTISEAETTDLSITRSDDDLDLSISRRKNRRNKKRAANEAIAEENRRNSKKIRFSNNQQQQVETSGVAQQVISQTIFSIPKQGGTFHAISTLETIPGSENESTSTLSESQPTQFIQPTAPPLNGNNGLTTGDESDDVIEIVKEALPVVRRSLRHQKEPETTGFGRTLSSAGGSTKTHAFVTKTVIKPETCDHCGKKLKFTKTCLKCIDCRATCHPECRERVPLPCITVSTPSRKNQAGGNVISDYTSSSQRPMVPAIIQHCVNEIESRGLTTVGLYRVPGSEKEVRELRERFARGKGVPNLSRYDIASVCSCLKDFLRNLSEPLVGRWFWKDFALATEISDPVRRQAEITRSLDELPPSNQDTLAFILLHLQRIAEIPEIKMPMSNLAKVFGPAIIGYSGPDIDNLKYLGETKKQVVILETLLSMSPDFWKRFLINKPENSGMRSHRGSTLSISSAHDPNNNKGGGGGGPTTPRASTLRSSSAVKQIYFTDDSPKETTIKRKPKKYFD